MVVGSTVVKCERDTQALLRVHQRQHQGTTPSMEQTAPAKKPARSAPDAFLGLAIRPKIGYSPTIEPATLVKDPTTRPSHTLPVSTENVNLSGATQPDLNATAAFRSMSRHTYKFSDTMHRRVRFLVGNLPDAIGKSRFMSLQEAQNVNTFRAGIMARLPAAIEVRQICVVADWLPGMVVVETEDDHYMLLSMIAEWELLLVARGIESCIILVGFQ